MTVRRLASRVLQFSASDEWWSTDHRSKMIIAWTRKTNGQADQRRRYSSRSAAVNLRAERPITFESFWFSFVFAKFIKRSTVVEQTALFLMDDCKTADDVYSQ